jgi:hypothetical protein
MRRVLVVADDDAPPSDVDSGTVTLRPSTPKEH